MTMKMLAFTSMTVLLLVALLLAGNCIATHAREEAEEMGDPSTQKLRLVASNPFRMVIRPTLFELDFVALSVVEEAMATSILRSTGIDSSLLDVNINVNQMNWISNAGENNDRLIDGTVNALGVEGIPTTVLKFFAVGTFLVNVPAGSTIEPGSLAAVKALDEIVENAFSLDNYGAFVQLMRDSGEPLLQGVQDAVAIRTNENPTPPTRPSNDDETDDDVTADDQGPTLEVLDYVFIVVCSLMVPGIFYVIWQMHRERGVAESRRRQALNADNRRTMNNEASSTFSHRNTDEDSSRHEKAVSISESIKSSESSKTSVVNNRNPQEEQPSNTSSSLFTTTTEDPHSFITNFNLPPSNMDINTHLKTRRSRYSSKVRISIESVHCDSRSLPTPSSTLGIASASSEQSIDDKSECKSTGALSFTGLSAALSSEFGSINWFRKSASKGLSLVNSNDHSSNIEEPVDEEGYDGEVDPTRKNSSTGSSSSSTDSSESDVFQIGNIKSNVAPAGSVANGSDASKASSVVTEWMKTIRVVASTDSVSGSDITCKGSSSEQSSTAANSSTEAPTVDDGSDEIESLEHSLANSKSLMSGFGEEGATMEF